MKKVTVIDYGIGNLLSVQRAFENQGAEVSYAVTAREIKQADRLVLPGVGAFRNGIDELEKRGLADAIRRYCEEDRPFLGICLGMQMMMEESEEFGVTPGLGIIPGRVVKIPGYTAEKEYQKVPHVGWNRLVRSNSENGWEGSILEGVPEEEEMYFVHSYTAQPLMEENRLADAYYGGQRLAAVIRKGNCYGTQFHPEKSGKCGLQIIWNFIHI